MAKQKVDGVVQAVHYNPDGQVSWVRVYLRRGATYSDRIMLDRQTLINHLKSGKHYFAGQPVPQMASTFKISDSLRLIEKNGKQVLATGNHEVDQDHLEGIPLI